MSKSIKKALKNKLLPNLGLKRAMQKIVEMSDRELDRQIERRQHTHPNPFVRYGAKHFSQADEDGLTLEIIRRLGLEHGRYAEFGVGDGLENNTLILAALGWSGFWVGGGDLAVDIEGSKRFSYFKAWVTGDNIVQIAADGVRDLGGPLDLISLDLDGNDLYFVEALLKADHQPKVFIVEYNAKFPPPVRFAIDYDEHHEWQGDDYFGASLSSFADLFNDFGYSLICCNAATGVNAFFVKNEFRDRFPEIPRDIRRIYCAPHYYVYSQYGHRRSKRVIEKIFRS